MVRKLFKNVLLFDGTGAPPYLGEALIHGNRIETVARTRPTPCRWRAGGRRRRRHLDAGIDRSALPPVVYQLR